jgi:hypothetical protein
MNITFHGVDPEIQENKKPLLKRGFRRQKVLAKGETLTFSSLDAPVPYSLYNADTKSETHTSPAMQVETTDEVLLRTLALEHTDTLVFSEDVTFGYLGDKKVLLV